MLDSHSLSYLLIGKSVSEYDLFFCSLVVRWMYTLTLVKHPRILAKMCSSMHASEAMIDKEDMCLTGVFVCDVTGRPYVDGPTNYLLKHSIQLNPQFSPILMPCKVNNVENFPQASRIG